MTNVAFRCDGTVAFRRRLKTLGAMDALPQPAYDLVSLEEYFHLNPARMLNFDAGRGCIFRCSFCYSPGHWGQGGRTKSTTRIVDEMRHYYEMGARHLFFVQDNLANSAAEVKELCQALITADTGMTWDAYATLPRLVPDLLRPLAAAGCTELFVGVDAISEKAQLDFEKHFFKSWDGLKRRLEDCLDLGIIPTCAFMIDLPDGDDCKETDNALLTALLARNLGCGIRLNTLTVYNATHVSDDLADVQRHYTELKPRLLLDTPPIIHTNSFAQEHPELFPFHSTVLPVPVYEQFVSAIHVAYTLFTSYPRTMLRYAIDDQGSLWGILTRLAGNLGDLVAIEVRHRRSRERELFRELFAKLSVSAATADAFALENAELEVSLRPATDDVTVVADDETASFRVLPYSLVRLGVPLAELSLENKVASSESPGHHLVYRDGGELRYCLVNDSMVSELARIRQALSDGGDLLLSADVLAELMSAGLFQPAEVVKEV
jgi:hypothetical protein